MCFWPSFAKQCSLNVPNQRPGSIAKQSQEESIIITGWLLLLVAHRRGGRPVVVVRLRLQRKRHEGTGESISQRLCSMMAGHRCS